MVSKGDQDCGRRHLPPQRRFTSASALFATDNWLVSRTMSNMFEPIFAVHIRSYWYDPKDDPTSFAALLMDRTLQGLMLHAFPWWNHASTASCHIMPHFTPGNEGWCPGKTGQGHLGRFGPGQIQHVKRMECLRGTNYNNIHGM